MTRGKEVQDFIKSQKKTAREMWEECDWSYSEERYYIDATGKAVCDEIVYRDGHKKIVFDLISKEFGCMNIDGEYEGIDMETNRLIQIQLKELGWI